MGKTTGFMEHRRELPRRRPVPVRLRDWREVYEPFPEDVDQASRGRGAWTAASPSATTAARSGNLIPEWNDLVYRDDWPEAMERLHATNNFPEFTGRLCPAPCEASCVLGINEDPVTIERIEYEIVERAWSEGWVTPQLPTVAHRQVGRGRRVGPRRAGGGAAVGAGRAPGDGVRAGREAGRPAALRDPRVQDGEGRAGPPPGPDGGRRRDLRVLDVGGRRGGGLRCAG